MSTFTRLTNRYWIGGVTLAFVGVGLARLLAPQLAHGPRLYAVVAGQLLALAGLFVIALGVRQRLRSATTNTGAPQS